MVSFARVYVRPSTHFPLPAHAVRHDHHRDDLQVDCIAVMILASPSYLEDLQRQAGGRDSDARPARGCEQRVERGPVASFNAIEALASI